MDISIIIPTLNEADGIGTVIDRIHSLELEEEYEIIVVDGESTDGTQEIASQKGAEVVVEPRSGYGRAYKTGFDVAEGDIFITLDGDTSYPPEEIPRLLNLFDATDASFLNTNRIQDRSGMKLLNYYGNHFLSAMLRLFHGKDITDSQSGMWVFDTDLLDDISIEEDGMAMSQEIKIKAYDHGYVETPIGFEQRVGDEELNVIEDGCKNLYHLWSSSR